MSVRPCEKGSTTHLIGYPVRNAIVNGRMSVVFNRIPSIKFSIMMDKGHRTFHENARSCIVNPP